MTTQDLTATTFETTVTDHDMVLVDFWASWCGPCRNFAPIYDTAAAANPDIVFGKVDTEAEQALAGAASITSIPTLIASVRALDVRAALREAEANSGTTTERVGA